MDITIKLVSEDGKIENDLTRFFEEGRKSIIVGRSRHCDIVIPDEYVSKVHCEIGYNPFDPNSTLPYFVQLNTALYIRDLSSTNGTYVNRHKIMSAKPKEPVKSGEIEKSEEIGETMNLRNGDLVNFGGIKRYILISVKAQYEEKENDDKKQINDARNDPTQKETVIGNETIN